MELGRSKVFSLSVPVQGTGEDTSPWGIGVSRRGAGFIQGSTKNKTKISEKIGSCLIDEKITSSEKLSTYVTDNTDSTNENKVCKKEKELELDMTIEDLKSISTVCVTAHIPLQFRSSEKEGVVCHMSRVCVWTYITEENRHTENFDDLCDLKSNPIFTGEEIPDNENENESESESDHLNSDGLKVENKELTKEIKKKESLRIVVEADLIFSHPNQIGKNNQVEVEVRTVYGAATLADLELADSMIKISTENFNQKRNKNPAYNKFEEYNGSRLYLDGSTGSVDKSGKFACRIFYGKKMKNVAPVEKGKKSEQELVGDSSVMSSFEKNILCVILFFRFEQR